MQTPVHYAYITNFKKLVRAVAKGKAPIGCLLPNQTYLDFLARNGIKNVNKIPGIEIRTALTVKSEKLISGRTGRKYGK